MSTPPDSPTAASQTDFHKLAACAGLHASSLGELLNGRGPLSPDLALRFFAVSEVCGEEAQK